MTILNFHKAKSGWALPFGAGKPIKAEHYHYIVDHEWVMDFQYSEEGLAYLAEMGYEVHKVPAPAFRRSNYGDPSPHLCPKCGQRETTYKICYECKKEEGMN